MSVDITQLVMDRYYINEKRKEIERLNNEIDDLQKGLTRRCTHPTTKTDRHYFPGSYYNTSYETVTKICTICDKILETYDDHTNGSYA